MIKNSVLKLLDLSKIVYLASILITLILAAMFFSSLNIEGYTKIDGIEYCEVDHAWDAASICHFYNTDALGMATISDGIVHGHCLKHWNIGTCPNVFPSLFILMILAIFIKNIALVQLANAFIQLLVFIILLNYLYKEIFPKISLYTLSLANFLLSVFLIWPLFYRDALINTNFFSPFHIGAFFNTMLAIILLLKYYKTSKYKYLIWYALLVIISFFSNSIFILFFGAPMAFALLILLLSDKRKNVVILLLTTIVSFFIGWLIYRSFVVLKIFYVTEMHSVPGNILPSLIIAVSQLKSLIMEVSIFPRIVFGATYFSIILFSSYAIFIVIKHFAEWSKNDFKTTFSFVEIYIMFFSLLIVVTMAGPILWGIYFSIAEIRYFIFGFFLGLPNLAFIADYLFFQKKPKLIALITICITILLIVFVTLNYGKYTPFSVASKIRSYYPGIARAVDDLSKKYPLKNGTGFHWDTHPVTYLSKNGNKVISTYTGIYIRHFGNNLSSFFYNNFNNKDTAFFNYIVLRSLEDTTQVCNFFGNKIIRVSQNGYRFYLVPDFYYDRNTCQAVLTNRNAFINSK